MFKVADAADDSWEMSAFNPQENLMRDGTIVKLVCLLRSMLQILLPPAAKPQPVHVQPPRPSDRR
jgi:hypothetical protein